MKTLSLIVVVLLLGASRAAADPAGCCKQRDSQQSDRWYTNNLGFTECEKLNQTKDAADDVFAQAGTVWWDLACVR